MISHTRQLTPWSHTTWPLEHTPPLFFHPCRETRAKNRPNKVTYCQGIPLWTQTKPLLRIRLWREGHERKTVGYLELIGWEMGQLLRGSSMIKRSQDLQSRGPRRVQILGVIKQKMWRGHRNKPNECINHSGIKRCAVWFNPDDCRLASLFAVCIEKRKLWTQKLNDLKVSRQRRWTRRGIRWH